MSKKYKFTIYGAGPSGLFCAQKLLEYGHKVCLVERSSALARKFLVAGSSGLNITHSEELDAFSKKYGKDRDLMRSILSDFSPTDLRDWSRKLGVETFVGTSRRVFPTDMSAAQMLSNWKEVLKSNINFTLITNCRFKGFDPKDQSIITDPPRCNKDDSQSDYHIFCLGGASWKKTGSDGKWLQEFKSLGINTVDFQAMNCGFTINWSKRFVDSTENTHLKNISLSFAQHKKKCEIMITKYGVEGSGIYLISRQIRDEISKNSKAIISIDLRPDLTMEQVQERIDKPRAKNSLSNHLRKVLKISKIELSLLYEVLTKQEIKDSVIVSKTIKNLQLHLQGTRDMDEAISTSGGISMDEVDTNFMLKKFPNMYVIGEMLDWDAPTGGYLLQACFSQAFRVASRFKN